MHRLVLAADPGAGHQLRGHAHEPRVAVLVRSSGLTADLHVGQPELPPQTARRPRVDHVLKHREHRVGRAFADGVLRLGNETGDQVALTVLDARHEDRIGVHALIGKGRKGAHQLVNVRFRRAESQRRNGVYVTADAHVVNEIGHGSRLLGLLHNPRRVVVAAARKSPLEGVQHPVVLDIAGLLGRPGRTVGRLNGRRQVGNHRAGRQAQMVDGEGVNEGLDRRADLAFALLGHVVLEVTEIRPSDIGFYEARGRIDRHHRGTHDTLVVEDRVARRHQRVALALIGEHPHVAGFVESGVDLLLARPGVLHLAVTVRITDGMAHDPVALLLVGIDEKRLRRPELRVHLGLNLLLHLPLHGLLGIGLHHGVDRGIDFQPVAVDIVGRAVGLAVLVTPAIERILVVLLHRLVIVPLVVELAALGRPGVHHQPQHLAEIGRRTLVVRHGLVVGHDRQRRQRIALPAGQRPGLLHA